MVEAREISLESSGAKFLVALDAMVHNDKHQPGFIGKVALGVREGERDLWWCAIAGEKMETGFSDIEPSGFDVSVLLGSYELHGFMQNGRLPADSRVVICRGDVHLFQRLMHRYADAKSAVDVRVSTDTRPRRRGKRGKA